MEGCLERLHPMTRKRILLLIILALLEVIFSLSAY